MKRSVRFDRADNQVLTTTYTQVGLVSPPCAVERHDVGKMKQRTTCASFITECENSTRQLTLFNKSSLRSFEAVALEMELLRVSMGCVLQA